MRHDETPLNPHSSLSREAASAHSDLEEMTSREKMLSGLPYDPGLPDLLDEQVQAQELMYEYNATRPRQGKERQRLLRKMFATIGTGCLVEPPLHANWGGRQVHFGNNIYAHFALTLVDDGEISVGDSVMFGPNVVLATAGHPVLPEPRSRGVQFNLPIHIERNVWLGANATALPGVRIGENSVIGAGSVVSNDVPPNVVAAGVPCKVLRPISERDREFYWRDLRFPN